MAESTCTTSECNRSVYARGVCRSHYVKARRPPRIQADSPARLCSIDGCGRTHSCHGLCKMHIKRKVKHGTTDVVNPVKRRSTEFPVDSAVQRCTKCRAVKTRDEFHRHKRTPTGLTQWCKECSYAHYRNNREKILRKARDSRLSRYGLTIEEYESILESQGGVCAICGNPPGVKRLAVDHDHSCCPGQETCGKCVRALLCTNCNPMLGYAKDDRSRLLAAVEYLDRFDRPRPA